MLDLETLFNQRLDEYLAGAKVLYPADMSNRKTYEADYNQLPLSVMLKDFRDSRMQLVGRLDGLEPQAFAVVAHHPRLDVPMRLTDMLFFQAEHDDFHMARISELIRQFKNPESPNAK